MLLCSAAACVLVVPATSPARAAPTSMARIAGNSLDFVDIEFSFVSSRLMPAFMRGS